MVGAGIDTLWPPELPTTVQLTTAVRLTGLPDELAEGFSHTSKTVVRDPNGEVVSEAGGDFELEGPDPPEDQREWLQGIVLNLAIGFDAAIEGTYMVEHSVDQSSATVAIHVRMAPPE